MFVHKFHRPLVAGSRPSFVRNTDLVVSGPTPATIETAVVDPRIPIRHAIAELERPEHASKATGAWILLTFFAPGGRSVRLLIDFIRPVGYLRDYDDTAHGGQDCNWLREPLEGVFSACQRGVFSCPFE